MASYEKVMQEILQTRAEILRLHYWGWHVSIIAFVLNEDRDYVREVIIYGTHKEPYFPHY